MARLTRIAARRLRVVLEEPVDTADDIGGSTRSFTARASLWGRLEPRAGRMDERSEAQQAGQTVTHRLTLRWRADVTAEMRLRAGARLFGICACFDPDGRRRDLVCLVEEMAP